MKVLRGYKNVTMIASVILSFVLFVIVCHYMLFFFVFVCLFCLLFHVYLELVVLSIPKGPLTVFFLLIVSPMLT